MRAGNCLSSRLSPRLSDGGASAISAPAAASEAPLGLAPTTRRQMTYTLNLHGKLTEKAYGVHSGARPSARDSTWAARSSAARVSRPCWNRDHGDGVGPAGHGRGL